MPSNKCCVFGCTSGLSVRKHNFPTEDGEFATWVSKTGNANLLNVSKESVRKTYRICTKHFESSCYSPGTIRLKKRSLPTLALPTTEILEISSDDSEEPLINEPIKTVEVNVGRSSPLAVSSISLDSDSKLEWREFKKYYNEARKTLNLSISPEANGSVKQKFMNLMKFKNNVPTEKRPLTNMNRPEQNLYANENQEPDVPSERQSLTNINEPGNKNQMKQKPDDSKISSQNPLKKKIVFNTPPNKKMKHTESVVEMLEKKSKDHTFLLAEICKKPAVTHEHPVRLFFNSMAETVMNLPPRLQVDAKMKVFQIITDLEQQNLSSENSE